MGVYKTDEDDGQHAARSATHRENTAIATAEGDIINIERSQKFTHITTSYDVSDEKSARVREIHDEKSARGDEINGGHLAVNGVTSKQQRPLSSVRESEQDPGQWC